MPDLVHETQLSEPGHGEPTQLLQIDLIRTDGGTQTRSILDGATIDDYAARLEGGSDFPPGIVYYDGDSYWLAAGFHRLEAHRALDAAEMLVVVRQGTVREAILCALGQNERHGLRRTAADRRRAVTRMLEDPEWRDWGNAQIARTCDVHAYLVAQIRTQLIADAPDASLHNAGMRTVQRGGTTYPIRPANQYGGSSPVQQAQPQRPAGIREPDLKPRYVQIQSTLESIDRAMGALPAPDLAAQADPEFDLEAAARHARWWQSFAAHLKSRADRAS